MSPQREVSIAMKGNPVRPLIFVLMVSLFFLLAPGQAEAQPQQWELLQNDPNPFCGVTPIEETGWGSVKALFR